MLIPVAVLAGFFLGLALVAYFCKIRLPQFLFQLCQSQVALENFNLLQKLTCRDGFESLLRADTGKSIDRPFGTNQHFFYWDKLQFNPVFLTRQPITDVTAVETGVVLGPGAKKPLRLAIPILIGGMSYGNALSLAAKIALAKAATLAGTAANTGNGPFLDEERYFAKSLVLQLSRGFWSKSPAILAQADMIEIALGHGAWGSAPVRIDGYKINHDFAVRLGTIRGLDVLIQSSRSETRDYQSLKSYIRELKRMTGGVPIGVKFGATHYLESELELIIESGADVIIFDTLEGGTHASPVIIQDHAGLPLFPALCRAVRYLKEVNQFGKISLVVGGGLVNPGDFLKCLALGADAVIIGTIAILAMSHTQVTKAFPWEPPTGLVYHLGKDEMKLNPKTGAENLGKFLGSCRREMQLAMGVMGKRSFQELTSDDLVALDPLYARIAGVQYLSER